MEQDSTVAAATPAATPKAPRRVPKFYSDFDRPEMNRLQKSFYRRTFLPSLLAGDPVDVQGQSGYGSVLVHELLDERRTNPIEARDTLESLVGAYRYMDRPYYAESTLADFYFLEGDFASGYATLGSQATPSHHLTLSAHLDQPRLTARHVLRWAEYGITQKGLGHLRGIVDALQGRLDEFHASHGVSLVEDFWRRATSDKSVTEVAASIEADVALRFTGDKVRALISEARKGNRLEEPPRAFAQWPEYEEPIDWPAPWVSTSVHSALLFGLCRTLTREAENAARDEAEIPRVGEGWMSEMTLLRQVQTAFPEERVMHQARLSWLAPQSLDIYLSDYNIGIEYQGTQHSTPVEHFGGAKAFELQQERDARKQDLCRQNGCVLIEVHPDYQLEQVIAQVKDAMQKADGGPPLGSGEPASRPQTAS
jgi:hypothetical protein